jgi:heme exporter protein A
MMIVVQGLEKSFGKFKVLQGLTFSVQATEKVVLLGINGAGKTTLMKILATLSRPSRGEIRINGHLLEKKAQQARQSIGMVSHASLLYGDLSARENLEFYAKLYDVQAREERIDERLQQFDLFGRQYDLVRTFSRGMLQRLALARATLHGPELLLLDEPFSGLDVKSAARLLEMLDQLHEQGTTIFMTTHDLDLARNAAPRILLLKRGKIALDGQSNVLSKHELIALLTS